MQNLIICMESFGEISCFCREGKMVFFWSKKGFCFCFLPFQKRYYLIASVYTAVNTCWDIISFSFNMVNFPSLFYSRKSSLTPYFMFIYTVFAFKVVLNSSWKQFKVPVDKTGILFQTFKLETVDGLRKIQDQLS